MTIRIALFNRQNLYKKKSKFLHTFLLKFNYGSARILYKTGENEVNDLKLKWLVILALVFVLSGGRIAMADGGHNMNSSTSSQNEHSDQNMDAMDMGDEHGTKNMDGMEEKDMNDANETKEKQSKVEKDSHEPKESPDMEGMKMEGSDEHGHEPVKEKPANMKVLGTYGAVNLSFIVIGVWNKWFRRKDVSNGNPQ